MNNVHYTIESYFKRNVSQYMVHIWQYNYGCYERKYYPLVTVRTDDSRGNEMITM